MGAVEETEPDLRTSDAAAEAAEPWPPLPDPLPDPRPPAARSGGGARLAPCHGESASQSAVSGQAAAGIAKAETSEVGCTFTASDQVDSIQATVLRANYLGLCSGCS
ncbi:hypothetical protein KSS87_013619 [Heliosperma pusillum]|nr:hypothetical protein KSS87_013619 [Heliosperma pusillum]